MIFHLCPQTSGCGQQSVGRPWPSMDCCVMALLLLLHKALLRVSLTINSLMCFNILILLNCCLLNCFQNHLFLLFLLFVTNLLYILLLFVTNLQIDHVERKVPKYRVFVCACPSVISSIPGQSFHFPIYKQFC